MLPLTSRSAKVLPESSQSVEASLERKPEDGRSGDQVVVSPEHLASSGTIPMLAPSHLQCIFSGREDSTPRENAQQQKVED